MLNIPSSPSSVLLVIVKTLLCVCSGLSSAGLYTADLRLYKVFGEISLEIYQCSSLSCLRLKNTWPNRVLDHIVIVCDLHHSSGSISLMID